MENPSPGAEGCPRVLTRPCWLAVQGRPRVDAWLPPEGRVGRGPCPARGVAFLPHAQAVSPPVSTEAPLLGSADRSLNASQSARVAVAAGRLLGALPPPGPEGRVRVPGLRGPARPLLLASVSSGRRSPDWEGTLRVSSPLPLLTRTHVLPETLLGPASTYSHVGGGVHRGFGGRTLQPAACI